MKKQEIWRELAQRELARRSFAEYLAYVQGRMWKRTRMAEFLAGRVQAFLETETGHAYDILLIETPPQHGKSMTVTESVPSWYLGKHPAEGDVQIRFDVVAVCGKEIQWIQNAFEYRRAGTWNSRRRR